MTVVHYKDATNLEDITCDDCLERVGMVLLDTGSVKCLKCSNLGTLDLHSCPFSEEITGNYAEDCNCCADCRGNCAMEI